MYIKNLEIQNFRNYDKEEIEFSPKTNIIIGNNAQGKTNIIESIYTTSIGKSFRTNKDSEMIKFDRDNAIVRVIAINKYNDEIKIDIIFNKKDKKRIKINGSNTTKNSEILKNIFIVVFSPEDLKIVKEGPEKRRRFIDRELCQIRPIYYHNLAKYKKIVLQRNVLLKENIFEKHNEDLFDVWDKQLVDYGNLIIRDRSVFIKKISEISNKIHKEITNNKEELEVIYENNVSIDIDAENYKEMYFDKVKKNRKRDFYRKNTSIGPHKDDLKILINGIDARSYGSQGQQRTAALSLKLAEIKLIEEETNEKPILLLDDVLSELDISRQQFLISTLKDLQIFITTTEINELLNSKIDEKEYYKVINGKIERK